jgi:catechol 2,3-dioxygenase-like lactoylglutathione lyase family enzyme
MDNLNHPEIVAPVSRFLGTADAARCMAFYRDILGFDIREASDGFEAVYGPARLQFGSPDFPPLDWGDPRPPERPRERQWD